MSKPTSPQLVEDKFKDVFKGVGCLPGQHTIKIDQSVPPVIHPPPRKIPTAMGDKVKAELRKWKKQVLV